MVSAVFSSSHCSKKWCVDHYGLKGDDIPVLHTGIDTERFSPRAVRKFEDPTIVFVGKLVPNKGVHTLVEAACKLAEDIPRLRLRIIGSGTEKEKEKYVKIAEGRGFPELVDFVGFVSQEDLPNELSKCHIFASASEYEGGPGFVAIEAMACGLPVVVCSGSGADEEVKDGETGLSVPPNNVERLTEALGSLLKNESLRESMGEKARMHTVSNCDSGDCIKRIESFYQNVIFNSGVEESK